MLLRRLPALVAVIALAGAAQAQQSGAEDGAARRRVFSFQRPEFPEPATSPLASIDLAEQAAGDLRPINIGGWTQASYTASTDRSSNGPIGFNDRANQFLLQQNWLQIDRPVDVENAIGPTFGFRLDSILPGSDYRYTLPRGLFNGQLTANGGRPNLYGIDPVQFYAEAYLPNVAQGMSIKLGRFYAIFDVEAINSPANALLSHAYKFIYNPFTQTGLLTTTKLNDTWSMQAGIVIGNDMFITQGNEPRFTGTLQWAPPDSQRSLRFATILGSPRYNQRLTLDSNNLNLFEVLYTRRYNDRWKYTLAGTYSYQTSVPGRGLANWYSVQQYLTRQFNERVSGTLRLEFFDDAQGQRTFFPGLYTALTAGLRLQIGKAFMMHPELRYDYNGYSRPFQGQHGIFLAATDFIWSW